MPVRKAWTKKPAEPRRSALEPYITLILVPRGVICVRVGFLAAFRGVQLDDGEKWVTEIELSTGSKYVVAHFVDEVMEKIAATTR